MDGSSLSPILIPIVVMISLAAWLIAVAYTAGHLGLKHSPASPQGARTTARPYARIPLPRPQIPRAPCISRPELGPWSLQGTQATEASGADLQPDDRAGRGPEGDAPGPRPGRKETGMAGEDAQTATKLSPRSTAITQGNGR